ncbi:MAG: hypothetical protein PVJ53_17100 [Desulfobacterales bacterium]
MIRVDGIGRFNLLSIDKNQLVPDRDNFTAQPDKALDVIHGGILGVGEDDHPPPTDARMDQVFFLARIKSPKAMVGVMASRGIL